MPARWPLVHLGLLLNAFLSNFNAFCRPIATLRRPLTPFRYSQTHLTSPLNAPTPIAS